MIGYWVVLVLGIALAIFGGWIMLTHPNLRGGSVKAFTLEVSAPGAGLVLIVVGISAVAFAAPNLTYQKSEVLPPATSASSTVVANPTQVIPTRIIQDPILTTYAPAPRWYKGPDVYPFQNGSFQIYIYDWAVRAQNLAGNAEIGPRVAGSFSTPACSFDVTDTYLLHTVLEIRSPTFPCGPHAFNGPEWDVPDTQLTDAMVNQVDAVMQQFGWVDAGLGHYNMWWNHAYTRPTAG